MMLAIRICLIVQSITAVIVQGMDIMAVDITVADIIKNNNSGKIL